MVDTMRKGGKELFPVLWKMILEILQEQLAPLLDLFRQVPASAEMIVLPLSEESKDAIDDPMYKDLLDTLKGSKSFERFSLTLLEDQFPEEYIPPKALAKSPAKGIPRGKVLDKSSEKDTPLKILDKSPKKDLPPKVLDKSPKKEIPLNVLENSPKKYTPVNVLGSSPEKDTLSNVLDNSPKKEIPSNVVVDPFTQQVRRLCCCFK